MSADELIRGLGEVVFLVFNAVGFASDLGELAVMDEAVQDSGGDDVVVEDLAPFFERTICGEHNRSLFIAARDQLKEPFSAHRN